MAPNGSRRLVACGPVPHTRSRRRNTRLGTPSKAWLTALCLLLFALPVSAASEARQTDDCASRVASALTPVPPEDVTPAMRAGLVEACEGVVAALDAWVLVELLRVLRLDHAEELDRFAKGVTLNGE